MYIVFYSFSALWCCQVKLNAPGLKPGVPTTNLETKENNVSVWGDIQCTGKNKPTNQTFCSGFFTQGDKVIKTNTNFAVWLYSTSVAL